MVGRMEDLHWKRRFRLEWQTYDCLRNDTPHDRLLDCIWTRRSWGPAKAQRKHLHHCSGHNGGNIQSFECSQILGLHQGWNFSTSMPRPERQYFLAQEFERLLLGEAFFCFAKLNHWKKIWRKRSLARNLLSIHAALEKHHFWGPADVPMAIYYRCPPLFYPLWTC